jgi:uncharacterized protein (TIGR02246 family)
MSDDVVFLTCGQPPMRGKSAFATSQAALSDIQATSEIQEIKVLGEWAYLWTHLSIVVTPKDGAPVKRAGNTMSILQKQAGSWRIVRDANMLTAAS